MDKLILVAGATGNLGERICRELIKRKAKVRAIVRPGSSQQKIDALRKSGIEIYQADLSNDQELIQACSGVSCIVSAVAGLHDVIVDTQMKLLQAALAAGVPRFIPSDFCTDFTEIPKGENRNFDLRKEFQEHLDKSRIRATSIFNGAFADILWYNTPLFNVPERTIAYYDGKADWKIDFTTMDNTAAFTAAAALDETTPRFLRIASFQVSPEDLARLSESFPTGPFTLQNRGSMEAFSAYNKRARATHPEGENELYAQWQQSQYLYSMFLVHHASVDNERYPDVIWSPVEENIKAK